MRPFGSAVESAVQRSGDRIGRSLVPRTVTIPGGKSGTFTAPESGFYRIEAWGGGAQGVSNNSPSGASGAYSRIRVFLDSGAVLTYSAGLGGRIAHHVEGRDSTPSTVSGPGFAITAGAASKPSSGNAGSVGVATGGDINVNGSPGGYNGAPGPSLTHSDGDVFATTGGAAVNTSAGGATVKGGAGQTPSAGGGFSYVNGGTGIGGDGGDGLIIISFMVPE